MKKANILIVDDDYTTLTKYRTNLEVQGHNVETASSLNEAITVIKRSTKRFTVLVVDFALKLKKIDTESIEFLGLQLMDFTRQNLAGAKIIGTSYMSYDAAQKLTKLFDIYVQKNGDQFDEIVRAVDYAVNDQKPKPRVFIGSSREKIDIAHCIQENLTHDCESVVWDQDVFRLSRYTLESLLQILKTVQNAVFVFSPDDKIKIRGKEYGIARDNIIFEVGLAIGILGRENVFMVQSNNLKNSRILSDISGITIGTYEADRSDKNMCAALGPFCTQIKRVIVG